MAYNDKIVIQQSTESRDDYGEVDTTWATYKTVWAEIDDSGGSRDFVSDMPVYEDSMSFKIRQKDAPDVSTKMRISWNSQIFYIRSKQRDGRLRYNLMAEAFDDE